MSRSQVAEGLAEAYHSNRTLIFGRLQPRLLDRLDKRTCAPAPVAHSIECVLLPFSQCSLADVSRAEWAAFVLNPFADSARVKLAEARRGGPSLVVPPPRYRHVPHARRWWASLLLALAFRPRPEIQVGSYLPLLVGCA